MIPRLQLEDFLIVELADMQINLGTKNGFSSTVLNEFIITF